jgi:hypothetical protein
MKQTAPVITVLVIAAFSAYGQESAPAASASPGAGAVSPFAVPGQAPAGMTTPGTAMVPGLPGTGQAGAPAITPAPGTGVLPGTQPFFGQTPGGVAPGTGVFPGTPVQPGFGQQPGLGVPAPGAFPGTPAPGSGFPAGAPPVVGQPWTGFPAAEAIPGTPAPGVGALPGSPPFIGQPGAGFPAVEAIPGTPAPGTGIFPGAPPVVGQVPEQFAPGAGGFPAVGSGFQGDPATGLLPGWEQAVGPGIPGTQRPGVVLPPGVGTAPGWASGAARRQSIPQAVLPGTYITPPQMENINRLTGALLRVGLPTIDTRDQYWELLEVLHQAGVSSVQPPAAAISQLARNLVTVLPMLNLTADQRRQLAVDINMIVNAANLPAGGGGRVLADARGILQGTGRPGADLLLNNLEAILAQVQPRALGDAPLPPPLPSPSRAPGNF